MSDKEFFVGETDNKELANNLRLEICRNFDKVWVCVFKFGDLYKVSIANTWGGLLEKDLETSIAKFANNYLNEPKETKKPKKVSKKTTVQPVAE